VNSHTPTLLTLGSGTLTSGNADGKGRFGPGDRFVHRFPGALRRQTRGGAGTDTASLAPVPAAVAGAQEVMTTFRAEFLPAWPNTS
jgi:hypothetical protein